jgi:YbbR domain-containing protein
MTKVLKWTRSLLLENFGWKLLSLAIAVVIWALVASEPELTTLASVRLEYKNLPDELEISSATVDVIRLELRGPSGELRGVGETGGSHPAVVLDMSAIQPGEHTFTIGAGNVKLPRGVQMVRAIPAEVHFDFERRQVRSVPVVVRFTGEGQNGYVIASQAVDPQELRIVGPTKRVSRVNAAVTDPVDVSAVVGTSEFRVNAFVDDPYVRFESSPQVRVTVTMKKK